MIYSQNLKHGFFSVMMEHFLKQYPSQLKAQKKAHSVWCKAIRQISDILNESEFARPEWDKHIGFFLDSPDGHQFAKEVLEAYKRLAMHEESLNWDAAIYKVADDWIEYEPNYIDYLEEYQRTQQPSQRPYWIALLYLTN